MATRGTVRRVVRKLLLGTVALAAIVIAIAAGALVWLTRSDTALAWAIERIGMMSGAQVSSQGLTGTLAGPISATLITFENDDLRVSVSDLNFDWRSVRSLWYDRRLTVEPVSIGALIVEQKKLSAERGVPPTSLQLPLAVNVPRLAIDRLEVRGGGTDLVLIDIGASYRFDRDASRHYATLDSLTTPYGALTGAVELGAREPFALAGSVNVQNDTAEVPYSAQFSLGGELRQIGVGGAAQIESGEANFAAVLQPYTAPLVDRIVAATDRFDLRRLKRDLPETELTMVLQGALGEGNRFNGTLAITNARAGTLDRNRIPIDAVSTTILADERGAQLRDLVVTRGTTRVAGTGSFTRSSLALQLGVSRLDLAAIDSRVRPSALAGELAATLTPTQRDVRGRLVDAGKTALALDFDVTHDAERLLLRALRLQSGAGVATGAGSIGLAGTMPIALTGQVRNFDPSRLGSFPQALVNGTFDATGTLGGATRAAAIEFSLRETRWRGLTAEGTGRIRLLGERLERVEANLLVAENRITVDGAFGGPNDVLRWSLDAPKLAQLGVGVAGRGRASGTLSGTAARPVVEATVDFEALSVAGASDRPVGGAPAGNTTARDTTARDTSIAVDGLSATLRYTPERAVVRATATRLGANGVVLNTITTELEGTLAAHRLIASARGDGIAVDSVNLALVGGWRDADGWRGTIEAATLSVPSNAAAVRQSGARDPPAPLIVSLIAPAALTVKPQPNSVWQLDGAMFSVGTARVELARVAADGNGVRASGRYGSIALTQLLELLARFDRSNNRDQSTDFADAIVTDLRLGGTFDLRYAGTLDGEVVVRRESGDVTIIGVDDRRVTLGLSEAQLTVVAAGNRLSAKSVIAGTRTGRVDMDLSTQLSQRNGQLGIAGDAPLNGRLKLSDGSLALARIAVPRGVFFDGRAVGDVAITGTVRDPQVNGVIDLTQLRITLADEGVRLRNGVARLRFENREVVIESSQFAGEKGIVKAVGRLGWLANGAFGTTGARTPSGQISVDLVELDAFAHPDYDATLSGRIVASLVAGGLTVSGKLRADTGVIRLPDSDRPSVASDVTVKGRSKPSAGGTQRNQTSPQANTRPPSGLPVLALELDLGDRFTVTGRGVNARLAGSLVLSGGGRDPLRISGRIATERGTVVAYGQKLEIESGSLIFSGALDNPALNIVAVRPGIPTRVGVRVTGFAQEPRATLFSTDPMTDSQRLAWLVLGRSTEGLAAADLGLLAAAASAVLGGANAEPLTTRVAKTLGLDELLVRAISGVQTAVVSVGKRLSDRLLVSVESGIQGLGAVIKLRYEFNRQWSVQTQTGTANTVDLFYTLRFD